MAKKDFLAKSDGPLAAQLEHFRDQIAPYLGTFDLGTPAAPGPEITAQAADATAFRYFLTQAAAHASAAQSWTAYKNAQRDGGEATVTAPAFLTVPAVLPAAVPPGIVPRFRALVASLKTHKNYTEAIGQILQIEGSQDAAPDLENSQPDLTGARVVADEVRIPWTKGAFDGILLEVDRGDAKGFTFLATDSRPDYVDTAAFPIGGATWKYRAIYLMDDRKVGQWSAVVSVAVGK